MEIVIIHHHLNPGGVTRIIASQIEALKDSFPQIKIKLLTGSTHEGFKTDTSLFELKVFEPLNYLMDIEDEDALKIQYQQIYDFLKAEISQDNIVHIHNPNLGKNPLVTLVLRQLVEEGYKILNHAHDFAEDRPNNWDFLTEIISKEFQKPLADVLYPKASNYLLAVLNSFDLERLQNKGIKNERLYLLPNPVSMPGSKNKIDIATARENITKTLCLDPQKLIITYPVRVIERKNIGEYILLCALFSDKASWLVTQPPKNPKELVAYNEWKEFCVEQNIPLHFEVGNKVDFEELIASTDISFTTSAREGFGMAYMEPWIMDTPVVGRNLDYITKDLKARGIKFPYLYDSILIDNKDFAEYTAAEQKDIISECIKKSSTKEAILKGNKKLINIFEGIEPSVIAHNKDIIRTGFSLQKYAEELYEIYERLA